MDASEELYGKAKKKTYFNFAGHGFKYQVDKTARMKMYYSQFLSKINFVG